LIGAMVALVTVNQSWLMLVAGAVPEVLVLTACAWSFLSFWSVIVILIYLSIGYFLEAKYIIDV